MGKHSDSKPSLAENLSAARRAFGAKGKGRHSGDTPSTATGILRTVKRRPVLAGLIVPAAAGMALVVGGVTMSPDGGDKAVVSASTETQASETQAPQASEAQAPKETPEAPKVPSQKKKGLSKNVEQSPEPKPTGTGTGTGAGTSAASAASGEGNAGGGISDKPCKVSAGIEGGLTANAKKAFRAVCNSFPEVKTVGGARSDPGSDHNGGQALDIMIDSANGKRIVAYLKENSKDLNVKYVIHEREIWLPGKGSKGMEDRGSPTQNHMDHVHLSVN